MLYPELFKALEEVRWNLAQDVPWLNFDARMLTDEAKRSFAKIGVLMTSSNRVRKALHPTNLHVNKGLFPNDTVQSRLPDPSWLARWLDQQIEFDERCEKRVVTMILRNLSSLFGQTFDSAALNRFRKSLAAVA